MRFGHYTVFDTPEENKHTQVYVEYDVPNNDDLEGATGTIVLTEGGQGSGGGDEGKNGLKSITISPAITTTPAIDSMFPIYWEDLTDEQKQSGITLNLTHTGEYESGEYTITAEPTNDWYAGIIGWASNPQVSENAGEIATASKTPTPPSSFTVAAMSSLDEGADMVTININIE